MNRLNAIEFSAPVALSKARKIWPTSSPWASGKAAGSAVAASPGSRGVPRAPRVSRVPREVTVCGVDDRVRSSRSALAGHPSESYFRAPQDHEGDAGTAI